MCAPIEVAPTIAESCVVTAPLVTVNFAESNDATPLLLVVASSAAIVTVVPVAEVSIPSPPTIDKTSESRSMSMLPLSVVTSRSCAVT